MMQALVILLLRPIARLTLAAARRNPGGVSTTITNVAFRIVTFRMDTEARSDCEAEILFTLQEQLFDDLKSRHVNEVIARAIWRSVVLILTTPAVRETYPTNRDAGRRGLISGLSRSMTWNLVERPARAYVLLGIGAIASVVMAIDSVRRHGIDDVWTQAAFGLCFGEIAIGLVFVVSLVQMRRWVIDFQKRRPGLASMSTAEVVRAVRAHFERLDEQD